MARASLLLVVTVAACEGTPSVESPLPNGDYVFTHRFAEHPDIPSIKMAVQIRGRHVTVINNDRTDVFPAGLIEEGELMWHASSLQWIIGTNPSDAEAPDVGGCSDGPSVIDLQRRVYWTC